MMTIKIKLDEVLFKRGIRVPKASELTGLDKNTLYGLTSKRYKRIDFETLNTICRVLECDITDVIEYVKDEK